MEKRCGEMIGYTIAILFLTIFYFIIMNALILNNAENVMEECVMNIGRQVVTCESLKDAQDRVQDVAEYYLPKETKVIDKSSIKATVTFAPGYKKDQRKWAKEGLSRSVSLQMSMVLLNGSKNPKQYGQFI
ncbi:MAG: hypothetical protein ACLTX3_07080 [Lachnospiraceae bacterium]